MNNTYSLEFINQLKQQQKYRQNAELLSEETHQTISDLCREMSITYSRKIKPTVCNKLPAISKNDNHTILEAAIHAIADLDLNFEPESQITEEIETIPDIKPISFVFRNKKTPLEKLNQNIRACLNKVSPKNVINQKSQLVEYLQLAATLDSGQNSSDCQHVRSGLSILVDVCVSTKFFSETFRDIISSVLTLHVYSELLQSFICQRFRSYIESFDLIYYVDPDTNYDVFCDIQKQNDKRRAETLFFCSLHFSVSFLPASVDEISTFMLNKIVALIEKLNFHHEVEEICENLSICLGVMQTAKHQFNKNITSIVLFLASMKAKEKPSLSIRAIFALQRTTFV